MNYVAVSLIMLFKHRLLCTLLYLDILGFLYVSWPDITINVALFALIKIVSCRDKFRLFKIHLILFILRVFFFKWYWFGKNVLSHLKMERKQMLFLKNLIDIFNHKYFLLIDCIIPCIWQFFIYQAWYSAGFDAKKHTVSVFTSSKLLNRFTLKYIAVMCTIMRENRVR